MEHGCWNYRVEKHLKRCLILMILVNSCLGATTDTNVEKLFTDALNEQGQSYLEIRQNILDLAVRDNSYLKEQSKSAGLQTRLLAQAILERAENPQKYRHFEELMIVPITQAVEYEAMTVMGAKPFETIRRIAQDPTGWDRSGTMMNRETAEASQEVFQSHCHDESAFLFLAEMALKNTMLDVPELSEQIEWTDNQKTYSPSEVAEMLGIFPETAKKWHRAGLFLPITESRRYFFPVRPRGGGIDLSAAIRQSQVRTFYQAYSDKVINPEYLRSKEPVSRVVHSDMQNAFQQFQQDPGSLFRCYAVLMIQEFNKPETPELLYEVFKNDSSEYVRAYCVEGFSAETQVPQIRRAMKATMTIQTPNDMMGMMHVEMQVDKIVPAVRIRKAAVIKSRENLSAYNVADYIESIAHEDYQSRDLNVEIATILGEKGDIAAIEPLIEMFRYDYSKYENDIAKAVIAIDPNSMYKALEHQNQKIRTNAWWALDSSGIDFPLEKDYLARHLNDRQIYYSVIRLIAKNYPESLKSFLEHENPWVRIRTIERLVENPEKYLKKGDHSLKEILLMHIQDSDPKVRKLVLWALGECRLDKEDYTVFLDFLKDPEPSCRVEAIRHLKDSVETTSILDAFLMQEVDSSVRAAAVHYLSRSQEPSRYKVLIKYINDKSPQVRRTIVQSLGEWEDKKAVDLLYAFLNDSDLQVQQYAIESIARRDIKLLSEVLPTVPPKLRHAAYLSLTEIKTDKAIDLLIEGTQDDDVNVRFSALWGLTKQKRSYELDHPAVLAAQKCLSDTDSKIRKLAIDVLYKMTGDSSLEQIAGYLNDSDKSMRAKATRMLGRSKSRLAVKYLLDAIAHEEDKEVLVEMVRALQEITGNLLTKDEWLEWWEENKRIHQSRRG